MKKNNAPNINNDEVEISVEFDAESGLITISQLIEEEE